jgi:hypothetical protein
MFGGGKFGWKEALMGALAGFMARRNPAAVQGLMAMMQQKQSSQREEQQYQRRRGDEIEDYRAKKGIDAQFPSDRAPYRFESNSGDVYELGPDGQPRLMFKDPLRFKLVPNGMGGVVPVDVESLMRGGAPQGPVGKLTPIDEGGPGLGAPGGFL